MNQQRRNRHIQNIEIKEKNEIRCGFNKRLMFEHENCLNFENINRG